MKILHLQVFLEASTRRRRSEGGYFSIPIFHHFWLYDMNRRSRAAMQL